MSAMRVSACGHGLAACLLAAWFALGAVAADAQTDIVASALFEGRALLAIDGAQRMLRVGETSPEGVKLLAANAREAAVEVRGRRITLAPGRGGTGGFVAPARHEVAIARSERHQYAVPATVNGRQTRMLVDTGASVIAMNSREARRLGIDYRLYGTASSVQTAAGVVPAWSVLLDRVEVSGIAVRNVAAAVIEGDYPTDVLLGMSWLGRVTLREADGVLYLGEK